MINDKFSDTLLTTWVMHLNSVIYTTALVISENKINLQDWRTEKNKWIVKKNKNKDNSSKSYSIISNKNSYRHHQQRMQALQIPLILFYYLFILAITLGKSSRLHPVFADQPILVCSWVGVHKRMLLMSFSLLLQLCPACLLVSNHTAAVSRIFS